MRSFVSRLASNLSLSSSALLSPQQQFGAVNALPSYLQESMARFVNCLLVTLAIAICLPGVCLAQEDCDEEDVQANVFEGTDCDNDDVGPRVCGEEQGACSRGFCTPTGRTLFCRAGRCVAENEANVGYECHAGAAACAGNATCMQAREGDVERCVVLSDPGGEGCALPFNVCEKGSECIVNCGPSGCGGGYCQAESRRRGASMCCLP